MSNQKAQEHTTKGKRAEWPVCGLLDMEHPQVALSKYEGDGYSNKNEPEHKRGEKKETKSFTEGNMFV